MEYSLRIYVDSMRVFLNGFLKEAVENYPNESSGFLFTKNPYTPDERWYIFSVKNVSENKQNSWKPDKDDMQRVKSKAKKLGLIKIGNVHTHPYPNPEWEGSSIEDNMHPSSIDLKFAQKFNDLVRIIWVVQKGAFLQSFVHDKYGNEIPITLEGIEKESDVVD